jgi:hypothetical protein
MPPFLIAVVTFVAAIAVSNGAHAFDEAPKNFRDVAKWAVAYQDRERGIVEGVAFCYWYAPKCRVKFRDPKSGAVQVLEADGILAFPQLGATGPFSVRLKGPSPGEAVSPPARPQFGLNANDREEITIKIKDGGEESTERKPVRERATADRERIRVDLEPQPDGQLIGRWRYLANPLTGRDADHRGRVGIAHLLNDIEIPIPDGASRRPGGFLAEQSGGEGWSPLPLQVVALVVLEDQAGFDGDFPKFRHAWNEKYPGKDEQRTLVIVGRDLPVDEGAAVVGLLSEEPEIWYELVAVAGASDVKPDQAQQFERVWNALTKSMSPAEAEAFRKLDAVMVKATLGRDADAGPKRLNWASTRIVWDLQYGDNTAELAFVRVFNEKESEPTARLALPEQVVIEVRIGGILKDRTIPVRVGGDALGGTVREFTATQVPGSDNIFRTAPIIFIDATLLPPGFGPAGVAVIAARKGGRIFAGIDREKTHFLRTGLAVAVGAEQSTLWLDALKRAAACNKATFSEWPVFARQPAQTITLKRQKVDINYGDHAAMLILRDAFLNAQRWLIDQVDAARDDDKLTVAWHLAMHDIVTNVPDFPLAQFEVDGPDGGKVPFRRSYSWSVRENDFKIWTTADGMQRWREWRLKVSGQAMIAYRKALSDSLDAAKIIGECDREELLKLTGAGFKNISARIAPLIMHQAAGDPMMTPDRVARSYINNLDVLADRLRSVEDFSSIVNKTIVAGVGVVAALPALVWAGAGGAFASFVAGFAMYTGQSAVEIYDTHKQHEEVEFEYGASGALGLERYFDAKARQTEWWQTAVSIFGQGILQAAGAYLLFDEPFFEAVSVWRGGRVFARMERQGLSATRGLAEGERRDLAYFLLKERERIARAPVIPYRTRYAARGFEDLGEEARGAKVAAEAMPRARAIEAEAIAPATGSRTVAAPAAPEVAALQKEKTVASVTGLIREAETAVSASSLETAARGALFPKGAAFYKNLPPPNRAWDVTIQGQKVTLDVGEILGQGSFFTVYKLKTKPIGLALDAELGDELVLKVANQSEALAKANEQVPGIAENIIGRMRHAWGLLKQHNISQLPFQAFDEAGGIVLQKLFKKQAGEFEIFSSGLKFATADLQYKGELGRALGELYNKIGDSGLIWLDGHLYNVFFEKVGGVWRAGVLDQDFITNFSALGGDTVYDNYLLYLRTHPAMLKSLSAGMPGDLRYTTARSVMHKMLEHKGWLGFDQEARTLQKKLLDPVELKKVIKDLRHVPAPVKGGFQLRTNPIRHFAANDNTRSLHLDRWHEVIPFRAAA